jgi:hypothetical protein
VTIMFEQRTTILLLTVVTGHSYHCVVDRVELRLSRHAVPRSVQMLISSSLRCGFLCY